MLRHGLRILSPTGARLNRLRLAAGRNLDRVQPARWAEGSRADDRVEPRLSDARQNGRLRAALERSPDDAC